MKKRQGFTIAEFVIVVAIITVITGFGFGLYKNLKPRTDFNNALTKIISTIQTARNYAMTSRSVYDANKPEDERTYIPPEGYGVYINKTKQELILFANTKIDTDLSKNRYDSGDGGDLIEETYKLPGLTSLLELQSVKGAVTEQLTEAVIIFRPPLAEAFASNNLDPANPLNLIDTLRLKMTYAGAPSGDVGIDYIKFNKTAGFPELEM